MHHQNSHEDPHGRYSGARGAEDEDSESEHTSADESEERLVAEVVAMAQRLETLNPTPDPGTTMDSEGLWRMVFAEAKNLRYATHRDVCLCVCVCNVTDH